MRAFSSWVRTKKGRSHRTKEMPVSKKAAARRPARKPAPDAPAKGKKRKTEEPETLPLFGEESMKAKHPSRSDGKSAVVEASPAGKKKSGQKPRASAKVAPETEEDDAPAPRTRSK